MTELFSSPQDRARATGRRVWTWAALCLLGVLAAAPAQAAPSTFTITGTNPNVTEGSPATFRIQRTGDTTTTVAVDVTVTAGAAPSATPATDFPAASVNQTITFGPGVTVANVTINTTADALNEADENFTVTISSADANFIAGVPSSADGIILNDDPLPAIIIGNATVTEGTGVGFSTLTFNVNLVDSSDGVTAAPSGQTVTVDFGTFDISAVAPGDYTANAGTLTFPPGTTARTITVQVVRDAAIEPNEQLGVQLFNATNATILTDIGTGTIIDDDVPTVTISPASISVNEGLPATVTVTLSAAPQRPVNVVVQTSNFDATAGTDYTPVTQTLVFNPGDPLTQTVTVQTLIDGTDEPDEIFFIDITSPTNANLGGATRTTVTIIDQDGPPHLSVDITPVYNGINNAISEGNSGTKTLTFTVNLAPVSGKTVSVQYATQNGTATSPSDYGATSGTITFAPGQTTKTVNVLVRGDTVVEGDETFNFVLSSAVNAVIDTPTTVATIVEDDVTPTVSISGPGANVTEGNAGTTPAVFTLTLSVPTGNPVTVTLQTVDGTAQASDNDYQPIAQTVTINAGQTSLQVPVNVIGDTFDETLLETFTVNITGATNAIVGPANSASATIQDDDNPPVVSIAPPTTNPVTEGGPAIFTVSLDVVSKNAVIVQYSTVDGTAEAGSDYTFASGTVTIPAGALSATITVATLSDPTFENGGADETFSVVISSPTGATLGTNTATALIANDDPVPAVARLVGPNAGYADFSTNGQGTSDGTDVTFQTPGSADVACYWDDGDNNPATPGIPGIFISRNTTAVPPTVTYEVPLGARTGPIRMEYPSGITQVTNLGNFAVQPVVTGFTPVRGVGAATNSATFPGTQVTITGRNFIENGATVITAVLFNGVPADGAHGASFMVVSDTTLIATVPNGADTGPIALRSSVPNAGTGPNSTMNFTIDSTQDASVNIIDPGFVPTILAENATIPLDTVNPVVSAEVRLIRAVENDPAFPNGKPIPPGRDIVIRISTRNTTGLSKPLFFVEDTFTGTVYPTSGIPVSQQDVTVPAGDLNTNFIVHLVYAGDDSIQNNQNIVLTATILRNNGDPRYPTGASDTSNTTRTDQFDGSETLGGHGIIVDSGAGDNSQVLRTSELGTSDPTGAGVTNFVVRLQDLDFINPFGPNVPPPNSPGDFNPLDPANRETEKNTDFRPKFDVLVTVQTSDTSEGLPSYYVRDFDNDGNGPDTAQGLVAVQPIPVATGQQVILFSVDVTSPEFYRNPHIIRVTGQDDLAQDGDQIFNVTVTGVQSNDPEFNDIALFNNRVTIVNTDNEGNTNTGQPGFLFASGNAQPSFTAPTNLRTSENGSTDVFTVRLNSQPTANVTFRVTTGDPTEGLLIDPITGQQVETVTYIFTPTTPGAGAAANVKRWDTQQTVTIKGQDDVLQDGNQQFDLLTTATSGDTIYNQIDPPDPQATNVDNEAPGVTVLPTLLTIDEGTSKTFTVVLNLQPTADVIINLRSSDTSLGRIDKARLTFTPANWNVPQTVTVTTSDDTIDNADQQFMIITDPPISSDASYNGIAVADVTVFRLNNDFAGLVVTPINGLVTTEQGGTASFTVRLNSVPSADVMVDFTTSDPTEGLVSVAGQPAPTNSVTLTFTPANFNTLQTVTITGQDDTLQDGDQAYQIVSGNTTSTDPNYAGLRGQDVTVTNRDDEVPGVRVTPTSITTTEQGGTAVINVRLNIAPTADVTVRLHSSNVAEGKLIDPATSMEDTDNTVTLTFTPGNFAVSQPVTVKGQDDLLKDGNVLYSIVTDATVSTDNNYNGIDPIDVVATNVDNEVPSIVVAPVSGLRTSEAGGTDTFTVQLGSPPTAPVTIPLRSSKPAEGLISTAAQPTPSDTATLVFDSTNFSTPQTVTVTGVDDTLDDGDVNYVIITDPAISTDTDYNGLNGANVAVRNKDDEDPGIIITPAALTTNENQGTATFTVRLEAKPTPGNTVTLPVVSADTTEGQVSPTTLTFDETNFDVPQTVTISVQDDLLDDGDVTYNITLGPANSADPAYNGLTATLPVTNVDNDIRGIRVTPKTGLVTTETRGTDTFTIRLLSQPTSPVTITLRSSDLTEGTVSPATVTFDATNFSTPRTITIRGVDDLVDDGDVAYSIITDPAVSADPLYDGLNGPNVAVTNIDDDTRGVTVSPPRSLVTTETGGTDTFTIVLNSQPTTNVRIPLQSSDTTEGKPSVGSVLFTPSNWNVPQTVTVTGQNDFVDDGDIAYVIRTLPAIASDPVYSGFDAIDPAATNIDNDTVGIRVTPTSGLTTTESGGTATFTIRLLSEPTAPVTISFTSDDTTEGLVAPTQALVIFRPATPPAGSPSNQVKWNVPFTVTVNGRDDTIEDGHITYHVVTSAASSNDPLYSGLNPPDVTVKNLDNDDLTAPRLTVDNPREGQFLKRITQVTGTAVDPNNPAFRFVSGIRDVKLLLVRKDNPATAPNEFGFYNPNTGLYEPTENQATQLITATYDASTGKWSVNLPTSGTPPSLADGRYQIRVFATDNAGNRTSAQVNFEVDSVKPTVTITVPTDNVSVTTLPQIKGTAADNAGGSGLDKVEIVIFRFANIPNGVFSGYMAADGSFRETFDPAVNRLTANGTTSWTFDLPTLFAAKYQVQATAIDKAGNRSVTATRTFTITGTGGNEFVGNVTYFISVPYMNGTGINSTTTPTKAFSVPPIDPVTGLRNYVLQRYNAQTLSYEDIGNGGILMRGEGYLLRPVNRGTRILRPSEDPTRKPLDSTIQEFQITLHNNPSLAADDARNGYNLIGDPFNPLVYSSADWLSARVTANIGGQVFTGTVAEAADRNILDRRLFTFDEASGDFVAFTGGLLPHRGVFVRTFVDSVQVNLKAVP